MASQYYTSKPLPPTPRCYANRCVADSCCGKNPTNSFHAITTPACTAAPTPSSFRNTAPATASYTATATTSPTYTTTAHRNTAPAYSTAQANYTSAAQPSSRTSHPSIAACRSSTQCPPITPTYTATCYSTTTHNITTPSSLPPTLEELMYRTQLEAEQHGEKKRKKGKRKCSLTGGVRRVLKK